MVSFNCGLDGMAGKRSGDDSGADVRFGSGVMSGKYRVLYVDPVGVSKTEFGGVDRLSASDICATMDKAVGKRAAGSLAKPRKMTSERSSGMSGLMRLGGVGTE